MIKSLKVLYKAYNIGHNPNVWVTRQVVLRIICAYSGTTVLASECCFFTAQHFNVD